MSAAAASGIACALLAAGASSRLGRPKQLLERAGEPLVTHALRQLLAAGCERYAVVLGCEAERVRSALGQRLGAGDYELLDNLDWADGMAGSIRIASAWAERCQAGALLLAVCDQPRLSAGHVSALCDAHRARGGSVASGYAGTVGVPALLDTSWYPRLAALSGDQGAGRMLRADANLRVIAWPDGAIDIDTEADAQGSGWG